MAARQGTRKGDNGETYKRSGFVTLETIRLVVALLLGGGITGGTTAFMSNEQAVLQDRVVTHLEDTEKHENASQHSTRIRGIIDRELRPDLNYLTREIEEIKDLLKEIRDKQEND